MDDSYISAYKSKISKGDPVQASGWGDRSIMEILLLLNHIQKNLEVERSDSILDIGCGAGLFSIGLAGCAKRIIATDFIDDMVQYAKETTKEISNISVAQMNILDLEAYSLPKDVHSCNKILMNSVLQAMPSEDDMIQVLKNLKRILNGRGKIFIGSNADRSKKEEYIQGYYKLGLSDEELEEKVKFQRERAIWIDKDLIIKECQKLGFRTKIIDLPKAIWQSWYMFDLLLEIE